MTAPFASPGLHDALILLAAAGLVIPAFATLRISPVIGFILVGIVVGHGVAASATVMAATVAVCTVLVPLCYILLVPRDGR